MRRFFCVAVLLLAGCQNTVGPFARHNHERVDDPLLSIEEQQRRGRERLALPDNSDLAGPRTGLVGNDQHDR
jgi:hypothetical protein